MNHSDVANRCDTAQYIAGFANHRVPVLALILGFSTSMIMVDFMHSDLGPFIAANTLLEFCEEERFGPSFGSWLQRLTFCLRKAWLKFKEWAKTEGIAHSQPCFTPARLSVSSQHSWPELKAKCHNANMVMRWLAAEVIGFGPPLSDRDRVRVSLLQGWEVIYRTITHAGEWLSPAEAQRLHTAGYVLVRSYKILAWSASRHNRARWQLKPKHHHILEGIHHAKKTLRNPRAHWLFKHEDFVGRIARLASKAHPTTCAKRALQLWAIKMALIRPRRSKGFAHRFSAKHGRKFRKLSFKR